MLEVTDAMMKEADRQWEIARQRANKIAKDNEVDVFFEDTNDSDLYDLFDFGNDFDVDDSVILERLQDWWN